ncbi:hypothetical protein JIG36_37550 [Actinoplanes sp. LDG1-06]|uniref:Uncharacterized protein n=1 Tax=Paractinoplanes ovalisporus TaxID=2810368 RepID=A0ABS2AMY3_9ACTN|nr:hypothetical protein [Actinoplanes ovalisporus]MBM2621224.1 hypothetical protein [Actinoplanes ovalisporus]
MNNNSDDEYGALLLRPLSGEPSGPPAIDVSKAMRDGRRRRRRWWAGGSALSAVAVTAVTGGVLVAARPNPAPTPLPTPPPDPAVPSSCTAAALPAAKYRSAEVDAGDSSGRWLIGRAEPDMMTPSLSKSHLVWHDGALVEDVVPPVTGVTMRDINASGVAVGLSDSRADHPWAYRDGRFTRLRGGTGFAVAINDNGQIAGQLGRDQHEQPVRWPSADADPVPLAVPDEARAEVRDIAPDGTVAGTVSEQGYLWMPDGTRRAITPPPVDGRPALTFDPLVFRYGWLYGVVSSAPAEGGLGTRNIVYRFHPGTGMWQQLSTEIMKTQVAAPTGQWRFGEEKPSVFVGRQVLSLPAYLPAIDAYLGSFVVAGISDDAHVVAGIAMSGPADLTLPIQPVIWRCRP